MLNACNNNLEPIPDDVMQVDQMTRYLIHVHIAETKTVNGGFPLDTSLLMYQYYHQRILDNMKLDTGLVRRSLKFYGRSPKRTSLIYERVVDSLGLRNSTANDRF